MSKFAQVQKQQKQLPFTVTPIGDGVALEHWKEYRRQWDATKQVTFDTLRWERRERAIKMVSDQTTNPFKYTDAEREEIEVRKARVAAAKAALAQKKAVYDHGAPMVYKDVLPKPTLVEKIKSFFNF